MLGYLTQRLGLSPIVGYLLAGTLVGPHTPGFVADAALAEQLAEVGVILLMFGVGLQFHIENCSPCAAWPSRAPAEASNVIVATAIASIVLNPVVYRTIRPFERLAMAQPRVCTVLNRGVSCPVIFPDLVRCARLIRTIAP